MEEQPEESFNWEAVRQSPSGVGQEKGRETAEAFEQKTPVSFVEKRD